MRAFSWVITERQAIAASKAHLDCLRGVCLDPPEPPYAIVLSDAGKKHLLYRGVVNRSRDNVSATLEGERIDYTPGVLRERLEFCIHLASASGKPALAEPITLPFAFAVLERYPAHGEDMLELWESIREHPLSRLSQWLCPNRDDCRARTETQL